MRKHTYYLVRSDNFLRNVKMWDIIKGYWTYSSPFNPKDDSKVYILGGYAIGWEATKDAIKKGDIKKISRKEAIKQLFLEVR